MGEATVMVHAILTIVGVVLSTIFATYIIGRIGYINSVISGVLQGRIEEIQNEVKIVAGFYNGTSEYDIFVKNIGSVSMPEDELYNRTEIYVGTYEALSSMYILSNTSGSNTAQLVDLNNDGVWSSGETVIIRNPPPIMDISAPVKVKIVLPSGSSAEAVLTG